MDKWENIDYGLIEYKLYIIYLLIETKDVFSSVRLLRTQMFLNNEMIWTFDKKIISSSYYRIWAVVMLFIFEWEYAKEKFALVFRN